MCKSPGRISPARGKGSPGPAAPLSPSLQEPALPALPGPIPGPGERRWERRCCSWNADPPWERAQPSGISARLSSFQGRVNCRSCEEEPYSKSLLTIFNLKMQMLLVSRSVIRVPLCQALTSIRGDYENISTLAFSKCHCDSTCCTNAWLSH